jgi:magnesium-protoporphyrin O-methyltransferase
MLAPEQGDFDHIVAMDSLIHYELEDALNVIEGFASRARARCCSPSRRARRRWR